MKHIKKLFILLAGFLIIYSFNSVSALALNKPDIEGSGVVLMDASTKQILFDKNMNEKLPPASTTKVMTALLTLEKTSLTDKVTISKNPPSIDGTSLGLVEGEVRTVEDLLNSLIIGSCNDAAEALAEHISGSTSEFVNLMNERAKELNALNTHFANPSGLYDKNHYTTAKDLSLILAELLTHDEFKTIVEKSHYIIKPNDKVKTERWVSNKLALFAKNSDTYYEYFIGGKTGYTIDSKHSFIGAAKKNDVTLITAIIHTDDKARYSKDAINLFEYGFNNFTKTKFLNKGDEITSQNVNSQNVSLLSDSDFYYLKRSDESNTPKINFEDVDLNQIDFNKDSIIENATISLNDKEIGTINLLSSIDKPSKNLINNIDVSPLILEACSLLLSLTIIFIIMSINKKKCIN